MSNRIVRAPGGDLAGPEIQYDLTVTGTNWTTTRAVGVPYQTGNGIWRIKLNVGGRSLQI